MSIRLTPRPPQTTRTTSTAVPTTTTLREAPALQNEENPQGGGILAVIGKSRVGKTLMGAAAFMGATSPMLQPVLQGFADAPARIAVDGRAVTPLQARADAELRAFLFGRKDKATTDDVAVVTAALEKGRITPAQTQTLVRDLAKKRGFTGEAAQQVTTYFAANEARLAPALQEHRGTAIEKEMGGVLVQGTASVDDVRQGAVGDCYLAASAAAIVARDPSFPHRVIEERFAPNGDRFFAVHLSRNFLNLPQGQAEVIVDDAVWARGDGSALYGQGATGHWFQVVESAAARLDGNFDKLESGFGFEALSRLTGLRAQYVLTTAGSNREALFETLSRHNEAGHAMTTGAHGFPDAAFVQKHQGTFATLHEYAILDVEGTSAKDGVVTLYNPWGHRLTVSIDEFARNFLGFSYVDLNQERGPVHVDPPFVAVLRRPDELEVEREERRQPKKPVV